VSVEFLKATIRLAMSVHPSVRPSFCPHWTTRFTLDRFSQNV